MPAVTSRSTSARSPLAFLQRERTVAGPGFNRWLVPPAALCVHLCIGEAYAFSVFNRPLSEEGWRLTELGWIFSIAIVCLGLSAAAAGAWLDRVGPRMAMTVAAFCFGGGFLVSAAGVETHQLWLLYLGYGVLGGCGLGLGYISPVKTLMTWFPDRPGMATGLAIMGFGGGALIAAPLSLSLMSAFGGTGGNAVAKTFVALGLIYGAAMLVGAVIVRVPSANWSPSRFAAPGVRPQASPATVHVSDATWSPQFLLVWAILCLNVTAGIGVLSQASVMSQEMFPGRIGPAEAAGFVGLLSLFNMGGRFFWASLSDRIGRKATYFVFFLLGIVLYLTVPVAARMGSVVLFVLGYGIILSMYGGGFATVPAYLRDLFGVRYVGAIHGRLLTAWAAAGVLGPVLVNYVRAYQIAHGVARSDAYTMTMHIMAVLLALGAVANFLVRPVHPARYLAASAEEEAA